MVAAPARSIRTLSSISATLVVGVALTMSLPTSIGCGPAKRPPQVPSASASASTSTIASASATTSASIVSQPTPTPASLIGSFGEGTFGPRLLRRPGVAGGLVVSAPRSTTGRRWIAQLLDAADAPIADAKHELAEAPEDTTQWDLRASGDGYLLVWTRPTDAGVQLLTLALAADGTPRGMPAVVARSGDEVVALQLLPVASGTGARPAWIVTYGERTMIPGTVIASGSLFALALDANGHPPTATPPMRLADRLLAWQVVPLTAGGEPLAMIAYVERAPRSAGDRDHAATGGAVITSAEDAPRDAKVALLTLKERGVAVSEATPLTPTSATHVRGTSDTSLSEIGAVETTPGHALVVVSDRRDLDPHLFSAAVDVSGATPKILGPLHRASTPRGEQSLTSLVATPSGAVLMWETVTPRPVGNDRRRFSLVRLSAEGESTNTPTSFWYPYPESEPDLVPVGASKGDKGDAADDVAVLTYGARCLLPPESPVATCSEHDARPFVLRLGGSSLDIRSAEMLDVAQVVDGDALHAFDLSCNAGDCELLVDGPHDPAMIAIAHPTLHKPPNEASTLPRYAYSERVLVAADPPRLDTATTLGLESQFAGLHATRTTNGGAAIAWITYASDEDVESGDGKPKHARAGGAARAMVRVVDAQGEPVGPSTTISERALSKGDVAVGWSAFTGGERSNGGVVAYVSRADGDEEVYTARIDAMGRRVGGSSRITHAPGGASDVAIAALPRTDATPQDGYLLSWVDARKESPAVYVARLDGNGQKLGPEVKVGGGVGGDVADVSMATIGIGAQGPKIAIVWSDARGDTATGFADIYVTIVNAIDPTHPVLAEHPVLKTALHSHNPAVTARGDGGALVAWMEDDPSAPEMLELTGAEGWGAYIARLDGQGGVAMAPTLVPITSPAPHDAPAATAAPTMIYPSEPVSHGGVVTGVSVDCSSGSAGGSACRIALTVGVRDGISVLGSVLNGAAISTAHEIWSYRGAPSQETSPSMVGTAVVLCEDGLEHDDARVRRLGVQW